MMSESKSRRKAPPARKAASRKAAAKPLAAAGEPVLINRLEIPKLNPRADFPVLEVATWEQALYAQNVRGIIRGGVVKKVMGRLYDRNTTIPRTPPENAAPARLERVSGPQVEFTYNFPLGRLGPVRPGALVRLVTWAEFTDGQVVLADNLIVMQATGVSNPSAEISEPKLGAATKDSMGLVKCTVALVRPGATDKIGSLSAKFYQGVPQLPATPDSNYTSKKLTTAATQGEIDVRGWVDGATNYVDIFFALAGVTPVNWVRCSNSAKKLS
jgi:hypothetical protein